MKTLSVLLFVGLGISSVALSAGCSVNEPATEKCKESKDSDSCSKCCTENKASGNTFSGSGCTCRGGS